MGTAGAGAAPGKGGVSRGRGDAALGLTGATDGATDALKAERLARGTPIPNAPSVVTYARSDPDASPVADAAGPGSAGDAGAGAATWRRRVAPHLREVVREFFAPAGAAPGPGTSPAPASSDGGGAGTSPPK